MTEFRRWRLLCLAGPSAEHFQGTSVVVPAALCVCLGLGRSWRNLPSCTGRLVRVCHAVVLAQVMVLEVSRGVAKRMRCCDMSGARSAPASAAAARRSRLPLRAGLGCRWAPASAAAGARAAGHQRASVAAGARAAGRQHTRAPVLHGRKCALLERWSPARLWRAVCAPRGAISPARARSPACGACAPRTPS